MSNRIAIRQNEARAASEAHLFRNGFAGSAGPSRALAPDLPQAPGALGHTPALRAPHGAAGLPAARPFRTRSDWPDYLVGQAERPVQVLLVDDDLHMRHVIAQELLADDRLLLVAQAESLRSGRKAVALHDFDVMLVDLNLGDGMGYDLIDDMKRIRPAAEAVVISVLDGDESALRAFELGPPATWARTPGSTASRRRYCK